MFKNLIYFDAQKVEEYTAVLKGQKHVEIKNIKLTSNKNLEGAFSGVKGGVGQNKEFTGEIKDNLILNSNEIETLLEKHNGEYFFDLSNSVYDSETVNYNSIVKFHGDLSIPEEFDMMDLINKFKPILSKEANLPSEQEEIFRSLFGKESTKLPCIFYSDDLSKNRVGFSKLNTNNLLVSLEDLEDFFDSEVTILARIQSRKDFLHGKPIVLFDIMKDLFSLNRAMRRQFSETSIEGIKNIEINKDVIVFEVLSIYQ